MNRVHVMWFLANRRFGASVDSYWFTRQQNHKKVSRPFLYGMEMDNQMCQSTNMSDSCFGQVLLSLALLGWVSAILLEQHLTNNFGFQHWTAPLVASYYISSISLTSLTAGNTFCFIKQHLSPQKTYLSFSIYLTSIMLYHMLTCFFPSHTFQEAMALNDFSSYLSRLDMTDWQWAKTQLGCIPIALSIAIMFSLLS